MSGTPPELTETQRALDVQCFEAEAQWASMRAAVRQIGSAAALLRDADKALDEAQAYRPFAGSVIRTRHLQLRHAARQLDAARVQLDALSSLHHELARLPRLEMKRHPTADFLSYFLPAIFFWTRSGEMASLQEDIADALSLIDSLEHWLTERVDRANRHFENLTRRRQALRDG